MLTYVLPTCSQLCDMFVKKRGINLEVLEEGDIAFFLPRNSECAQMESRWSSQPSAVAERVLTGTRRNSAEFAATQWVSEWAEHKPECKDLRQAEENCLKTLKSNLSLYFWWLKGLLWEDQKRETFKWITFSDLASSRSLRENLFPHWSAHFISMWEDVKKELPTQPTVKKEVKFKVSVSHASKH